MQTPSTTPMGRLGNVLYWASIIVGLLLGIFIWGAFWRDGTIWQIIAGAGVFLVCVAIGRASRYILAGK